MKLSDVPIWIIVFLVTVVAAWMVFGEDPPDTALGVIVSASAAVQGGFIVTSLRGAARS